MDVEHATATTPATAVGRAAWPCLAFSIEESGAQPIFQVCGEALSTLGIPLCIALSADHEHNQAIRPAGFLHVGDLVGRTHVIEVKKNLTSENISMAIHQVERYGTMYSLRPLLISLFVNDSIGLKLRERGIDYIDSAGNIHLIAPQLYLWHRGAKRPQARERLARAFDGGAGLQLIALLLTNPEAANWPYRQIADEAGISLGSVSQTFRELRSAGYLTLAGPGKKLLIRRGDLIEKWEFGYVTRLRPRLHPQVFRFSDHGAVSSLPDRITAAGLKGILIGGELAASVGTGCLRPERATLHVRAGEERKTIISALRLIPDEQGNLDVVNQIGRTEGWYWPERAAVGLAHPLLVYAELRRNSLDDRVRETAQQLYADHLGRE